MKNRKFFDLWSKDESNRFTKRLAYYCALRSGSYSEELCSYIANDCIEELCALDIDYSNGCSPREYRYARQCLAFYSKDADINIRDGEAAMYEAFIKSETKNRIVNQVWHQGSKCDIIDIAVDGIFSSIRRKITQILGDCPEIDDLEFEFGPGSNTNVSQKTSARHKLQATPACSEDMKPLLNDMVSSLPAYMSYHKKYNVEVGKLSSVPKNWKTRRSILIEPNLNTFVQKAIGKRIKARLLLFGCNLYSQVKNQQMALQGSLFDELMTLDLENASNSVCLHPVYYLLTELNEDWFNLLYNSRTGKYTYRNGSTRTLEMFSSMGNGFTFELESLIFYATALCVGEKYGVSPDLISVYGDDIIAPSVMYDDLVKTLGILGFSVNTAKTYKSGPFRESCGHDYYQGMNIRPFYKKDRWSYARLVGLINYDFRNYDLFSELRYELISSIPLDLVNFGPDGYGDGHIAVHAWELTSFLQRPAPRSTKQEYKQGTLTGKFFSTICKIPRIDNEELPIGDALYPLYAIYLKPSLRVSKYVEIYDVFGRIVGYDSFQSSTKDFVYTEDSLREFLLEVSRASDPYQISGGWKERNVRIYMLN